MLKLKQEIRLQQKFKHYGEVIIHVYVSTFFFFFFFILNNFNNIIYSIIYIIYDIKIKIKTLKTNIYIYL